MRQETDQVIAASVKGDLEFVFREGPHVLVVVALLDDMEDSDVMRGRAALALGDLQGPSGVPLPGRFAADYDFRASVFVPTDVVPYERRMPGGGVTWGYDLTPPRGRKMRLMGISGKGKVARIRVSM